MKLHDAGDGLELGSAGKAPSSASYRTIFERSNDGILIIDAAADKIVDANERACRMLGYQRHELLTLSVSAIHPNDIEKLRAFSEDVLMKGSGWTDELQCVTKNGLTLPTEVSASVLQIQGRRCILASVRDISHRVRAREAERQHSETLERLVEKRTEQLRRSERRSRLLLDVNNAVIAKRDREALFAAIAECLERVIPFERASLSLYDPEKDVIAIESLVGQAAGNWILPVGYELPRRGSRVGRVLAERRPVVIEDLRAEPGGMPEDRLVAEGIRAVIIVPLLAGGRAIGTLAVGSTEAGRYSDADADLLQDVAGQIGLAMENMLAYQEIAELKARLEQENVFLQQEMSTRGSFEEIIGETPQTQKVLKAIETVAPTEATVLILGETGTGKELVAQAVHDHSARKRKTLVKVNCAALPSSLIESEIFGHEKGAFTGAFSRKLGRFELAEGGTILLDEIGDLPLDLQAKLLRVLQDGEFERVGGSEMLRADVRVIAATNHNLEEAIERGDFRPDLYYRLNVFPIHVPPLRERRADIPLLVSHFAMKHALKFGKKIETIPEAEMKSLLSYDWPGNIRELENVIERAVIVSNGPKLRLGDWMEQRVSTRGSNGFPTLAELERAHILEVLHHTGWVVSGERGAAKILDLRPTTLEARMKKLGIERPGRRTTDAPADPQAD